MKGSFQIFLLVTWLFLYLLIPKSASSQSFYPRLIHYNGDSVIAITPQQHTTLLGQIAGLVEGKQICIRQMNELNTQIDLKNANISDLQANARDLNAIIREKEGQIEKQKEMQKNTRKKWIRNALYAGCGGLTAGLITGIIIVK